MIRCSTCNRPKDTCPGRACFDARERERLSDVERVLLARDVADALMVEYLENQGYEVEVAADRAKRSAIDFIDEDGARIETAQAEEAASYLLRAAWDYTCQA